MRLSKRTKFPISQHIFDVLTAFPKYNVTEEQKEFVKNNMDLYHCFLAARHIQDEDERQDIYMYYHYYSARACENYDTEYQRRLHVQISLRRCYLTALRNRYIRSEFYQHDDLSSDNHVYEQYKYQREQKHLNEANLNYLHECIFKIMDNTLNERQSEILKMRTGFYGKEMSYPEIAKNSIYQCHALDGFM